MVKDAKVWADKQLARVRVSGDDYRKGVENPKRNPIEAALAKKEKWKANMMKAIQEDRWAKTMSKLTLDDWRKPTLELGTERFIRGVEANEGKIRAFIDKFQPMLSSHSASIEAMPDTTDSEREARMLANLRGMKKLKGKWR